MPLVKRLTWSQKMYSCMRKSKNSFTSFSVSFLLYYWKPLTPRLLSGMRFPDIHHNELEAYWYFQSTLRPRCMETDKQTQIQFEGHFGIEFDRVCLHFVILCWALQHLGVGSKWKDHGILVRVKRLWCLNLGSNGPSDLMEGSPLHLQG
jgi:hypothetical protein